MICFLLALCSCFLSSGFQAYSHWVWYLSREHQEALSVRKCMWFVLSTSRNWAEINNSGGKTVKTGMWEVSLCVALYRTWLQYHLGLIYLPNGQLLLLSTNTMGFVKAGFHPSSQQHSCTCFSWSCVLSYGARRNSSFLGGFFAFLFGLDNYRLCEHGNICLSCWDSFREDLLL